MENTMLRLVSLLFVTLVVLSCQTWAQESGETADHQAIQGTWQLDTFHVDSEKESRFNLQYTFIKDKVSVVEPELGTVDGQYVLNSSVSPHEIDMLFKPKGGVSMHWKGLRDRPPHRAESRAADRQDRPR